MHTKVHNSTQDYLTPYLQQDLETENIKLEPAVYADSASGNLIDQFISNFNPHLPEILNHNGLDSDRDISISANFRRYSGKRHFYLYFNIHFRRDTTQMARLSFYTEQEITDYAYNFYDENNDTTVVAINLTVKDINNYIRFVKKYIHTLNLSFEDNMQLVHCGQCQFVVNTNNKAGCADCSTSLKYENSGYIYLLMTSQGDVKIGCTKKPESRHSSLKTANPYIENDYLLLKEFCHYTDIEKHLHRKFENLRVNGEWFRYTSEIKEYIEGLDPNLEKGLL